MGKNLHAFNCGANILAFTKNEKKYGMCCAWSQMVDYDKLIMLVGGQSITGNNLEIGMLVGVSALAKGQENIALNMGMKHSDEADKFANCKYYSEDSALLISNARNNMICRVVEFIKSDNIDSSDHLVLLEVVKAEEHPERGFLYGYFAG